MPEYTPTQGRYLSFIQAYIHGFGIPPAEAEISEMLQVAAPSVNRMLKTLQSKGLIRREPGVPRSIEILVDEADIPQWLDPIANRRGTGRGRTALPRVAVGKPKVEKAAQPAGKVYVFKITLEGSKPPIWRRIETMSVSLSQFHDLIQTAMGWTNSHLHQFFIGKQAYMPSHALQFEPDMAIDYTGITLAKIFAAKGPKAKLRYEYDFGDGWMHEIKLEETLDPTPGLRYPRCTGGQFACPPEDIGGIYGYYQFLSVINDPKHPQREEMLRWNGRHDANTFDPKVVSKKM